MTAPCGYPACHVPGFAGSVLSEGRRGPMRFGRCSSSLFLVEHFDACQSVSLPVPTTCLIVSSIAKVLKCGSTRTGRSLDRDSQRPGRLPAWIP